jgi:hypothetical protein
MIVTGAPVVVFVVSPIGDHGSREPCVLSTFLNTGARAKL